MSLNYLSTSNFRLTIKRLPNLEKLVQTITIPSVTLGQTEQPTAFRRVPIQGDSITYGELIATFNMDENLEAWESLYNWITGVGFPDNFEQYEELADQPGYTGTGLYSDATVTILNSASNPIYRMNIEDMWPVDISALELDTKDQADMPVIVTVTFQMRNFRPERLS